MCAFAFSKDTYRFASADARKLARTLFGSSYRMVRLTGGEPLLLDDICDTIAAFSDVDMRTSVITSGWRLSALASELVAANLDQVIVSLDAGRPEVHDRIRHCPGLFASAVEGLRIYREIARQSCLRVNTVVGPHNLDELLAIHALLVELDIDLWSIIPLKRPGGAWEYHNAGDLRETAQRLRDRIGACGRPRLVGHSMNWEGRTDIEKNRFLTEHIPFTPALGMCRVVDEVRYYTPKDGLVYPCNCVPHRLGGHLLAGTVADFAIESQSLDTVRSWLRVNGPAYCSGCEPANVSLGEGLVDLDVDPYGF